MRAKRTVSLILAVLLALLAVAAFSATMKQGNIIATAERYNNLSTFVKAVKAAGLTAELSKPGPFTVYAPDNDAFSKMPKATLDSLMKPANKAKLRSILLAHVVAGKHTSAAIMKMKSPMMVKTLQGAKVKVMHSKLGIMWGNSKVVKPDVMASNGVIHIIDNVVMPMMGQKQMKPHTQRPDQISEMKTKKK